MAASLGNWSTSPGNWSTSRPSDGQRKYPQRVRLGQGREIREWKRQRLTRRRGIRKKDSERDLGECRLCAVAPKTALFVN